ncbi:hypothetical protein I6F14_25310 [Bradyrhizobium sp. IC3069]|uniref:hypothetical protein n=1 Tax=unclassified Bradyrhizobium TaxID=2631580 RepID=UPI001CD47599|nr:MULTISPECIES: hypothetical protein [unclassified Bradyrhizobium]MCA1363689.1 hypothetical protein [Bradyrhizobium sp. IC4059]MCA1521246.1 hypothetical protein [Bradyrhizobium sp. IC3069]
MTFDRDRLVTFWKQAVDPLLTNGPFQAAREQRDQRGIEFNVRIITLGGEYALSPYVEGLGAFLCTYGFNTHIEPGVSVPISKRTDFQDSDIIIVFPLSSDLETLCLELAQDHAARMIVCVPSGDDGKVYCRLIREKYGVETVTLQAHDPLKANTCRCGVDLARHCANYLMKKVNQTIRQLRLRNTVVVLIHGIRTRALWQGPIRQTLERAGLVAIPTNYNKLDVVRFLLPFEFTKRRTIRRVESDVRSVRAKFPEADLSILAHSFGTFITGRLILNEEHNFSRIVLCGSILPIEFEFASAASRFSEIVNEVGSSDIWPAAAAKLGRRYGPTGSFGFNRPFVRDRRHAKFGHSSFLNAEFCKRFWVPYFCDGEVDAGDADASPSLLVRLIDSMPSVWVTFWVSIALLSSTSIYRFFF